MEDLVEALKAVAEPTRLRILAALESCELTVSEICIVLGQTQPRVSRHLRLLTEAGLLHRHAEGTSAYYGLRPYHESRGLYDAIAPLIDRATPILERDQTRLDTVRAARAESAASYFSEVAGQWDELREMHAPTADVEEAMLAAVPTRVVDTLLDIGTGTGRILELFANRTKQGLGIDYSRQMLGVARARIDEDRFNHLTVRHGDIFDLDIEDDSQDIVILHHVLHFLTDAAGAVDVASRVLAPGGTLLIVDFAAHGLERLRADHAHSHLGFTERDVRGWCSSLGLKPATAEHFLPPADADDALTVTLWAATKPSKSTTLTTPLEATK